MFEGGPTVSTFLVRMVIQAGMRRGLTERAFQQTLQIPTSLFERAPRVPIELARKVWHHVPILVDEPELGVLAAEEGGPSAYGFFTVLAESSPTWGVAMQRLVRCVSLANRTTRLSMEYQPSTVTLVFDTPNGVRTGIDLLTASICIRTRAHLGDAARPMEATYAFERPTRTAQYQRIFKVPVEFGAERTSLVFPRRLFHSRVPGARAELGEWLEGFALRSAELLAATSRPPPPSTMPQEDADKFLLRAKLAVRVCLEQGSTDLGDIAGTLGTSSRSLQRKLQHLNSSLRALIDDQRAKLATNELGAASKTVRARILGYSDRRSLRRAQARWHAEGASRMQEDRE